jgi:integrase
MSAAKKVLASVLSSQLALYDVNGNTVAQDGLVWKLSGVARSRVLNWALLKVPNRDMAEAIVQYLRYSIETKSHDHCHNAFRELRYLWDRSERYARGDLRRLLLGRLSDLRSEGGEWKFHFARDWYRWSFDQHLPAFDDSELLYEIASLRIPGNVKGEAVLSEDPEEGPLDEIEEIALRGALHRSDGALLERALIWTLLALGCNPKNLVYLCEEDFRIAAAQNNIFYSLDVPRIKKGVPPRTKLKRRKIDPFLARIFEQLVERNKSLSIPASYVRPLFARTTPRSDCLGSEIERYAYHLTSRDVTKIVSSYVETLQVISHRTGKVLRVTPRRLRYTFATRKVQEGCSMDALAELLDHTDLQNVMVYYAGTSMVKHLDEVLAISVGPLVNRFLGHVVSNESDALDGGGRVKAETMGRIKNIGTCGSKSLCTLYPPFSCYLCPVFQPWRDAPHRDVLRDLIQQRNARIEASGRADDRIAKQYDEIILAVGQVVAQCEDPS